MAKYSANLIKELIAELEKVPMIRQASAKVGVDHSTVYRWMIKHPDFNSKVNVAQSIGRKNITDAAESVIVHGIQNKDFRSAAFWLNHNEYRYMKPKQGEYYGDLIDNTVRRIREQHEDKTIPRFDLVFSLYREIELGYPDEPEIVSMIIDPYIEIICDHDPKLMDVFRSAYQAWKKERGEFADSARRAGLDMDEDTNSSP